MGLMDSVKAKLALAEDKMSDLARQHGGKVQHSIDKAAKAVDERTKGKYSDKIHAGTDKAKGAMDRLAHAHEDCLWPSAVSGPGQLLAACRSARVPGICRVGTVPRSAGSARFPGSSGRRCPRNRRTDPPRSVYDQLATRYPTP